MDFFIKINLIIEKNSKKQKLLFFYCTAHAQGAEFRRQLCTIDNIHVLARVQEAEFREQGAIVFLRFDCHIYRYYMSCIFK